MNTQYSSKRKRVKELEFINFKIPGPVVAQGRPRASSVGGRVRMYDPPKSRAYKKHVKEVAEEFAPSEPLEGALSMRIIICRQYLKSFTKKQRFQAEDGALMPTTKPDIDNTAKSIMDSLNGIIYKDDSQVVELVLIKKYAEESCAFVEINTI